MGEPDHFAAGPARLGALIDGWVGLAELQSLRDVEQEQRAPWASISQGAAGNAYALWYVATRRRHPTALAAARRWARFATRAAERRSGFRNREFRRVPLASSVVFGRPGLQVVDALLAHARGTSTARAPAFARLRAALTRGGAAPTEFMAGQAGALTAALLVRRCTGDESMGPVVETLAHRLLGGAALPTRGFAHGQAGVQHALLAWSHQTKTELPGGVHGALLRSTDAEIIAAAPPLAGTWCNGLTGFVLLWVKAYELTGDAVWRERARATARSLTQLPAGNGSLCCGLGGRAYALLALSRIDQTEDWRSRATELCVRGLGAVPGHGVFRGLPGLVCLAVDLTTPGEARFPLVEP